MANKRIYRIKVLAWEKYNGSKKKGHPCILLSTGFLSDAKIRSLTHVTKLLYLSCLLVAGESASSQIEVSHDSLVYQSGVKSGSLQSQLDLLQSLQLLTYEKIDSLINRIEKNRIEKNRIESTPKSKAPQPDAFAPVPLGQNLVAVYCDAYKTRYPENPVIRPQDAKALKNFGETVGSDQATELLRAYLRMNNSWFITKAHDLTTFLQNLNQVKNFSATGQVVTIADARSAESGDSLKNQIARLTGGES